MKIRKKTPMPWLCVFVVWLSVINPVNALEQNKSALYSLIHKALSQDSQRKQWHAKSLSLKEQAISQTRLMDPKIKVGVGGLPTNSFTLDSDPMTNVSVGLMQQFERGDSLQLKGRLQNQSALGMTLQQELREREVIKQVIQWWTELGYQLRVEKILEKNQALMIEMVKVIEADYALGKSDAQDLLNAQLHVSQLKEKQQANQQMQQRIKAQLSEWFGVGWWRQQYAEQVMMPLEWDALDAVLPPNDANSQLALLNEQPSVRLMDLAINISNTNIALREQAYHPQFGVEVMYSHRQTTGINGSPLPDLVSAFLTLDIPLFTDKKQDRDLSAAQYDKVAAKYQKEQLLTQLHSQFNALLIEKDNLKTRLTLYQNQLLKQAKARTQAFERGYQTNRTDFNAVLDAATIELTLTLEAARLAADMNITQANLAALIGGFDFVIPPVNLSLNAVTSLSAEVK